MKRIAIILAGICFASLGAGYELEAGDRFPFPVGFRVEPVFGNATPVSFLVHTGIRYLL